MKNKFKIIFLFFIFFFLFSLPASAASLNLVSPLPEMGIGQEFKVDLMLDAEGQDINAAQGKIVFPQNNLELKEIIDGNSIINLWIEKPVLKGNKILFSGVIPGGFSGVLSPYYKGKKPGKIFSLIFYTKSEGDGAIEIHDAKALLNDGKGTEAPLAVYNFSAYVTTLTDEQFTISNQIPKDIDPPELFTPEISRDPDVFDGKWFLVFITQDKGSGIDRYEVQETLNREPNKNNWQVAESPLLLKDQNRASYIFVKAVDRAGNQRIVVVTPFYKPWYQKMLVDIPIILAILIGVIIIRRWLRGKFRKLINM